MSIKKVFPVLLPVGREAQLALELRRECVPFIVTSVPWEMLEPHLEQLRTNHGQTPDWLANRGGLSAQELIAVLQGKRSMSMPHATAHRILGELILDWIAGDIRVARP